MERQIGEKLTIKNNKLIVTQTEKPECKQCFFELSNKNGDCTAYYHRLGECLAYLRSDNKNVVFKNVD